MSRARVTCVITAYQYGRFIARCLDSVLSQDHPADLIEVLVVDDGSTDDTGAVVAGYGDAVRYVRQDNAGQIAATNRGISEATGDYLILVDADDTIPHDRVSTQAAILDARPEVGLVYGDMSIIDADDAVVGSTYHQAEPLTPHEGHILGPLLVENFMPGGTMMFRAADRHRYHPIGAHASVQDWWIGVNLAAVSQVAYVPRPMNHYRLHGGNDNFGSEGERKLRLIANDLRFRRWMLRELDLSAVPVADIVRGWLAYDGHLRQLAPQLGCAPEQLAPVSAEDARRARLDLARARIARGRGDRDRALRLLVAAAAADPGSGAAGAELVELVSGVPAADDEPLDTRGFVTLATAQELLAERHLLHTYSTAFGKDDDATLVIYAPAEQPALVDRLFELVASAGLDGPESPDMVAVLGPDDPASHPGIGRTVHAMLSTAGCPGLDVPSWGTDGAGALRDYAQACLAT